MSVFYFKFERYLLLVKNYYYYCYYYYYYYYYYYKNYVHERAFLQHTCLFSNSSFSVLSSKNDEVMKLAATRYDETNVDIHSFLILNMEKPKFLKTIFLMIITIVCTNCSNTLIIVCTNYYFGSKLVYKLYFYSFVNDVLK